MTAATLPLPARRLLNLKQAAAYCGVSAATFQTHCKVAPLKIGKRTLYDVRDIDRWIDGRQSKNLTPGGFTEWIDKL